MDKIFKHQLYKRKIDSVLKMVNRLYPILPYNNYIGKPMYRFSKKYLSKSRLLALNMADLPASLVLAAGMGVCYSSLSDALILFMTHQIAVPLALLGAHEVNILLRKKETKSLESIIRK